MQLNTNTGGIQSENKKPIRDFSTVTDIPDTGFVLALKSVDSNQGIKINAKDFMASSLKPSTSTEENLITSTIDGIFAPDKTGDLASLETDHKSDVVNAINEVLEGSETGIQSLQAQIDTLVASSDVKDIVGTYAALQGYDTSKLGNNDIVKVLRDSTHDNQRSYYRWISPPNTWLYIGSDTDIIYVNVNENASGRISLTDNSVNKIIQKGAITFSVPSGVAADKNNFHQVLIQLTTNGSSIDLGLGTNPKYFNKTLPILSANETYNIYYEFDQSIGWVCGFLSKGTNN